MLRFAEEIVLLLLDEERGALIPSLPPHSLDIVLAGAVLMDLALEGRIDTDLTQLSVVDATPLDDDLLDPTLADIAQSAETRAISFWLARIAERGGEIRDRTIARLITRGILEAEGDALIFLTRPVSRSRRYPSIDGNVIEEVKLRIMRVLFSEEIPDPRDIMLICLADACGIFESILSKSERAEVQERIEVVRKLDLIGQAVTQAIRELEPSPTPAPPPRRHRDIPQAPGLPLIGNVFNMVSDLQGFLVQHYRTFGPIFRVRVFNTYFTVLVGPEANRFVAQDKRYLRNYESWLPLNADLGMTHLLIGMDGSEHTRMRRAHADYFSRKLLEHRTDEAVHIMRHEMAEWSSDQAIPVQYAFQRIVTTQLGELITNTDATAYLDDLIFFFQAIMRLYFSRQLPRWVKYLPRFRRTRKRVEELVQKMLEEHTPENRRTRPPDFIDDVLELNRTDPHFMPETNLLLTGLEAFMAGLDTISTICTCMTYELLKHPDLLTRAAAEADALFERGSPSLKDLRQLDVIHRVALETLRLYPLSPATKRTVANSFEFAGYHVPAGEQVLIGYAVPQLMEEYFPEPWRFDIERYTPERAEHRQTGVYAPFGVGTHQCLGRSLSEVLVALNIATLVHKTELVLDPPDYTLKIKRLPVAQPDRSFKFRVVRRRI